MVPAGTAQPEPGLRWRFVPSDHHGLWAYGSAPVGAVLATIARFYLAPALGDQLPFSMYFLSVVCSAWYGGLGPGLLATTIGAITAAYVGVGAGHAFSLSSLSDQAALIVYLCVGIAISLIGEAQRQWQKQAEAGTTALLESQRLLATTLRSIGDAVITTDADGSVTFINAIAEEMTGWRYGAAVGKPCQDVFRIINEHSRQPAPSPVNECLEKGRVVGLADHTLLRSQDGSERPIDDSGAPIKDDTGAILGSVLVFRDCTARKNAEREKTALLEQERAARSEAQDALRRSTEAVQLHLELEQKLTLLTHATGTLISSLSLPTVLSGVLDLSHRLVSADACAVWRVDSASGQWSVVAASGLSDDYLASAVEAMNRPDSAPIQPAVIEDLMSAGDASLPALHQALLREEGIRSALIQPLLSQPLLSQDESSGMLSFFYRDERRLADTDLKVSTAVANMAASAILTAELYENLRSRAEELAAADQLKNQFLAMLAHELRNPLGAISNAVKVMNLAEEGAPVSQRSREVVGRQTRHMSRLVDELLDVSRISQGKINLQQERMDLTPLIRATGDDHRRIVEAAGLEFRLTLPDEPLWVDADPTRLRQVLGNLLQNAAKFTDPGGRVEISAALGESGRYVSVSVSDTGIGIPRDLLSRLFEPFVQADRTLDRTQGGLGLGLALVKGIVELHNGHVRAQSAGAGHGAEFIFELPAQTEPAQPAPPLSSPEAPGGPLKVLIIEDNPDAAETMQDMMELFGHCTEVAMTGPDGVAAAGSFHPDVVLCDLGLPGMDGFAVAEALRGNPATSRCRLIAVSGYGQEEDVRRSRQAGFDLHFTKPVDPEGLKNAIAHTPRACPTAASR